MIPTPEQAFEDAEVVFIGELVTVEETGERRPWATLPRCADIVVRGGFNVQETFKGSPVKSRVVHSAKWSDGCVTSIPWPAFVKGGKYLVYASRTDGVLWAHSCVTGGMAGRTADIERLRRAAQRK